MVADRADKEAATAEDKQALRRELREAALACVEGLAVKYASDPPQQPVAVAAADSVSKPCFPCR